MDSMPFEQLNIEIIESYIIPCFKKLVRLLRPILRPRFPNLILQYPESYLINIGVCVDSESITRVFKYTLE